jgi:hypothetical protein
LLKRFASEHRPQLLVVTGDCLLADQRLDPARVDQLDMRPVGNVAAQGEAVEQAQERRTNGRDPCRVRDLARDGCANAGQ